MDLTPVDMHDLEYIENIFLRAHITQTDLFPSSVSVFRLVSGISFFELKFISTFKMKYHDLKKYLIA